MQQFVKLTKALSDQNRVTILKLLERRPLCVCELQALLDITQPTVSSHLRILKEAGLIASDKEGRWIIYRLEKISNADVAQLINGALNYLESDAGIKQKLAHLEKIDRHDLCQS